MKTTDLADGEVHHVTELLCCGGGGGIGAWAGLGP